MTEFDEKFCGDVQDRLAGNAALTAGQQAHLEGCEDCQAVRNALAELDGSLGGLEPQDAPDELVAATLKKVRDAAIEAPSGAVARKVVTPRRYWAGGLAASVVIAAVLGIGYELNPPPKRESIFAEQSQQGLEQFSGSGRSLFDDVVDAFGIHSQRDTVVGAPEPKPLENEIQAVPESRIAGNEKVAAVPPSIASQDALAPASEPEVRQQSVTQSLGQVTEGAGTAVPERSVTAKQSEPAETKEVKAKKAAEKALSATGQVQTAQPKSDSGAYSKDFQRAEDEEGLGQDRNYGNRRHDGDDDGFFASESEIIAQLEGHRAAQEAFRYREGDELRVTVPGALSSDLRAAEVARGGAAGDSGEELNRSLTNENGDSVPPVRDRIAFSKASDPDALAMRRESRSPSAIVEGQSAVDLSEAATNGPAPGESRFNYEADAPLSVEGDIVAATPAPVQKAPLPAGAPEAESLSSSDRKGSSETFADKNAGDAFAPVEVSPQPTAEAAGKSSGIVGGAAGTAAAGNKRAQLGDGLQSGRNNQAYTSNPVQARERAEAFLESYERQELLTFQDPAGYWANTYIPGDPAIRLLEARLKGWDRSAFAVGQELEVHAHPAAQPFDAPEAAALALYLQADRTAIEGPTRLRLQVGLKGAERQGGHRPAMNLGLVIDARDLNVAETGPRLRALIEALQSARQPGDRFSLTLAGPAGGLLVAPEDFRHGPLKVALERILNPNAVAGEALGLAAAVNLAAQSVRQGDDPNAILGSSSVLLVTGGNLAPEQDALERLAHRNALEGVTLSVADLGGIAAPELVDRLVAAGQGHRRVLETAEGAAGLVDRELHAASRAVARALRLRIRLAEGVKLVEVIGSHKLREPQAQRVREAEQSIDQRLARNLGITADRGEDEEGIQIVIPNYFAGDSHVILLDVVAEKPGPLADVTLRYKDVVQLKNGVAEASLSLDQGSVTAGPLERNVMKNLVTWELSRGLRQAAYGLQRGSLRYAQAQLMHLRDLIQGLRAIVPAWDGDEELIADQRLLQAYLEALGSPAVVHETQRRLLADSLQVAAFRKLHREGSEGGGSRKSATNSSSWNLPTGKWKPTPHRDAGGSPAQGARCSGRSRTNPSGFPG